MTPTELIDAIAKKTGFYAPDVRLVYDATMQVFYNELIDGNPVYLPNIGKVYRAISPSRYHWIGLEGRSRMSREKYRLRFQQSENMKKALSVQYAHDHPDDPNQESPTGESQ